MNVAEHAAGDAAEERGAVGRALVRRRRLQRQAEHGRDDTQPDVAAGSAARDSRVGGLDSEPAQELERVPQPERDALEHRTDEGSAVVVHREADERAAGVRIGVRRALSREVRKEEETVRPGVPASGLGDEVVERRLGRKAVAEPLEGPGGGEHHAHGMPRARHRVAERVEPACGLGPVVRERGEHDARGAEHDRERPGSSDAYTERGCRAVTGTGRHGNVAESPGDLGGLEHGRQPGERNVERSEHLLRPAPPGDVEKQRPRRIGDVGRPLTGEPKPHVVLGQADARDLREDRRLVAAQPEELRRREPRERAVTRQLDQALDPDQVFDLGALLARALVVPENRGTEHPVRPRRAPRARASGRRARCRRPRRLPRPPPARPRRLATSPPGPAPTSPGAESRADTSVPRAPARLRRPRRRPP